MDLRGPKSPRKSLLQAKCAPRGRSRGARRAAPPDPPPGQPQRRRRGPGPQAHRPRRGTGAGRPQAALLPQAQVADPPGRLGEGPQAGPQLCPQQHRLQGSERRHAAARQPDLALLGRLDRPAEDRDRGPLGHERRLRLRSRNRQAALADPLRLALPDCSHSPCTNYSFPTTPMENVRTHGAIPFFGWGSQSTPSSLNEPEFQLADVIAGNYDAYIRKWRRSRQGLGPSVLPPLRLGDERQLVPLGRGRQRQPARRIRHRLAPRARHLHRGRRHERDLGLVPERRPQARTHRARAALPGRRLRRLDLPRRLQLGPRQARG